MQRTHLQRRESGASVLAALVLATLLAGLGLMGDRTLSSQSQSQVAQAVMPTVSDSVSSQPSKEREVATAGSSSCEEAKKAAFGHTSSPVAFIFVSSDKSYEGFCHTAILKSGKLPSSNPADYNCYGTFVTVRQDTSRIIAKLEPDMLIPDGKCTANVCDVTGKDCYVARNLTTVNNNNVSVLFDVNSPEVRELIQAGASMPYPDYLTYKVDPTTDTITTLNTHGWSGSLQGTTDAISSAFDEEGFKGYGLESKSPTTADLGREYDTFREKYAAGGGENASAPLEPIRHSDYAGPARGTDLWSGNLGGPDENPASLEEVRSTARQNIQEFDAQIKACQQSRNCSGEYLQYLNDQKNSAVYAYQFSDPRYLNTPQGRRDLYEANLLESARTDRILGACGRGTVECDDDLVKSLQQHKTALQRQIEELTRGGMAPPYETGIGSQRSQLPNSGTFGQGYSLPNQNQYGVGAQRDCGLLGGLFGCDNRSNSAGGGGGLFGGGGNNLLPLLLLSRLMGGQGGLFGSSNAAAPQLACTSDPNIYNQQLQQYNYQLQLYNYQQQQRQNQLLYGSLLGGNSNAYNNYLLYSMLGGSSIQPPAQPCYQPAGSSYGYTTPYGTTPYCYQSPVQPDPSQCPNGSWRPIYASGSACMSGWQCVPSATNPYQPVAQLSCQPQVVDAGMTVALTYSCSNGDYFKTNGFETSGAFSGTASALVVTPPPGTNVLRYGFTCGNSSSGLTANAQCSVQVGKPAITIVAIPKTVPSGSSSQIGWVTSGMQSCVISSPQLPDFTAQNAANTSVSGVATTPPLTSAAQFILHCTTVGGGSQDVSIAVHVEGVADNLTDSIGSSGTSPGGTSGGGGVASGSEELASIAIQTTADAKTVARGTQVKISWETLNEATTSAVSLWLVDKRTDQATALIAGKLPLKGSHTWTIPAIDSTCPVQGRNVCGSDLVSGRQYSIMAAAYVPADAYIGDGEPPSLFVVGPWYGAYVISNPFTLQ